MQVLPVTAPLVVRAAFRTAGLSLMDIALVGLWHPALMAWRLGRSWSRAWGGEAPRRFAQVMASRREGVAAEAYAQGATPWWVLRGVARRLGLGPDVVFVDVGAADGMCAAVLSAVSGARGWGVEPLAPLAREATRAWTALAMPLTMTETLAEVPLEAVTAAYAGWTMFGARERAAITRELLRMPAGARVVTVTHPVAEADCGGAMEHVHTWQRTFPWGVGDLHLHVRR